MAFAAYEVSAALFAWMTPVIAGLVLAVPLAHWTASPAAGRALRRLGLLGTPEETRPPEIRHAPMLSPRRAKPHERRGMARLLADPALLEAHRAMLPAPAARKRGSVDAALVLGLAKIEDCGNVARGERGTTRRELMALLADARGVRAPRRLVSGELALRRARAVDLAAHDGDRLLVDGRGVPALDGGEVRLALLIAGARAPAVALEECRRRRQRAGRAVEVAAAVLQDRLGHELRLAVLTMHPSRASKRRGVPLSTSFSAA